MTVHDDLIGSRAKLRGYLAGFMFDPDRAAMIARAIEELIDAKIGVRYGPHDPAGHPVVGVAGAAPDPAQKPLDAAAPDAGTD